MNTTVMDREEIDAVAHRFWSKVDTSGDCHIWTRALSTEGYGVFWLSGQHRDGEAQRFCNAHLYAWLSSGRTVTPGNHLDHLCRNRRCVRVDHLEEVAPRENWLRSHNHSAIAFSTGVCKRGHSYEPLTRCKQCRSMNDGASRRRKRELRARLVTEARRQIAIRNGLTYLTEEGRAPFLEVG